MINGLFLISPPEIIQCKPNEWRLNQGGRALGSEFYCSTIQKKNDCAIYVAQQSGLGEVTELSEQFNQFTTSIGVCNTFKLYPLATFRSCIHISNGCGDGRGSYISDCCVIIKSALPFQSIIILMGNFGKLQVVSLKITLYWLISYFETYVQVFIVKAVRLLYA